MKPTTQFFEPLISIIVPSFNQAGYLEATLHSLLDQNDAGLEIVVVDGGSTDGSVEIIRRHEEHLAWWVSEPDRGQSHALNKGFAKAKGDWLGWLNSDDLLLPGALMALRQHVVQEPAREWWIGGGYFIDDRGRRFRDYRPPVGLREPAQLDDWRRYWFAQPSTFFRRVLFERAGGVIREDLHYAMDLDLWLRFLLTSEPGFIKSELSIYRLHAKGKTQSLAIQGEAEIVRVLIENLSIEAAMQRVCELAAERDALRYYSRRLENLMKPLIITYSTAKKLWKKRLKIWT